MSLEGNKIEEGTIANYFEEVAESGFPSLPELSEGTPEEIAKQLGMNVGEFLNMLYGKNDGI